MTEKLIIPYSFSHCRVELLLKDQPGNDGHLISLSLSSLLYQNTLSHFKYFYFFYNSQPPFKGKNCITNRPGKIVQNELESNLVLNCTTIKKNFY